MKLLTWNIQAGIGTGRFADYLLHAHRQLLHTGAKSRILRDIAAQITPYDVVCLQETDLGGRRAGYRSQVEVLAGQSGHAHVAVQQNRVVPGISRHGNAILSHWPLTVVADMKLPGPVAGRGCLIVDVAGPVPLRVACLHLSLGAGAQALQLAAVADVLRGTPAWVAMGDFNCGADSLPFRAFCENSGGRATATPPATYPSWRPKRDFDHIVSSQSLTQYRAASATLSDHLAVSALL